MGPWRNQNISPLYKKTGVEKFAFLFRSGTTLPSVDEEKMPDESSVTRQFISKNGMRKWLD